MKNVIEKIANKVMETQGRLEKVAVSPIIGALRADGLSAEEARELRKYYGLREKDGLRGRAYMRGWGHELMGALAGAGIGIPASIATGSKYPAAILPTVLGLGMGTYSTQKYSPENYKKLKREGKLGNNSTEK